jgi:hypothetical protein
MGITRTGKGSDLSLPVRVIFFTGYFQMKVFGDGKKDTEQ